MSDKPDTTEPGELAHAALAGFWHLDNPSANAEMSLRVARAIAEARVVERERCAEIVERHPDEAHPAIFDPEEVRGCCEVMAARIRSGE